MPSDDAGTELVRRNYESLNRGDLEAVLEVCDPDVVCVLPEGGINTGTLEGHEGVRKFLSTYVDAFEALRFDPERITDVGGRIVVLVRMSGRGRGSGLEVDTRPVHVWTLREGMVVRFEVYPDESRAELAT